MIITACQAAAMLSINEHTLNALAISGRIPHIRIPSSGGHQTRYNTADIKGWLKQGPTLNNETFSIARYKYQLQQQFPNALAELHKFDKQFIVPRRGKGYNLTKVANKKLGFVYYVRYIENGRLVPTRWSTHTNNEEAAINFAVHNRDKLLTEYKQRKLSAKTSGKLYKIMNNFYETNSIYMKNNALRGRTLSESARQMYHNTIKNHWIKFLKRNRIRALEEIDTPLLARFQDCCLAKGCKPQTVNHYVSFVSNIFDYLLIRGQIKNNPCKNLQAVKVGKDDQKITGCYEPEKMKGVFNKHWNNELSYMLCLLNYSTNLRNCEIERIRASDIITINKIHFINIVESKSRNGIRIAPIHNFVYRKLMRYIRKNNKGHEDFIFKLGKRKRLGSRIYNAAYKELAIYTNYSDQKLADENIKFYSGRHFWKTLMNANGLGDVEEYFMGHTVSNDVAKRYNHRDKQGQNKIVQKAREVFKILDAKVFRTAKY